MKPDGGGDEAFDLIGLLILVGLGFVLVVAGPLLAGVIDELTKGTPPLAAGTMIVAASSVLPVALSTGLSWDRINDSWLSHLVVLLPIGPVAALLCLAFPTFEGLSDWVEFLDVETGGAIVFGSVVGLVAIVLTLIIVFGLSRGRPGKRAAARKRVELPDWVVIALTIVVWIAAGLAAIAPYVRPAS